MSALLPSTLDEAVARIGSKFQFVADSVKPYEEFQENGQIVRATHATFSLDAEIKGQGEATDLVHQWFAAMLDAVTDSKRQCLFWRMKPEMKVVHQEFADGHKGWAIELTSRSSMV